MEGIKKMRSETFSKQTLEDVKNNCNLIYTPFKNARMGMCDNGFTIKTLNDNLDYSEFGGFSNDYNVDLKVYESEGEDIFIVSRKVHIISVNQWDYLEFKAGLCDSNDIKILKEKLTEYLNGRKSYFSELNLKSIAGDDNYELVYSNLEIEKYLYFFKKKYFLSGVVILAEKNECVNYVLRNTPIIIK